MNNRFKFRFFDKKKQKMMYENSDFSDYCKEEWWGHEERMALEALDVFDNPEHYILMQCTGLKDKNGKLIYEGDIVRDINIPSYFYIIVWFKGGFYLKSTVSNSFLVFDTTQQEVIGNIYENPELLEVCDDH